MSKMTSVDVFRKIKELSLKTVAADRRILVKDITLNNHISQDSLLVLLMELENRGLIKVFRSKVLSLSLTRYGISQSEPPPGIESD